MNTLKLMALFLCCLTLVGCPDWFPEPEPQEGSGETIEGDGEPEREPEGSGEGESEPEGEESFIVNFPDPNLEAEIREALNKPTGDIYATELSLLTGFNPSNQEISDLSGLEHCTGLLGLELGFAHGLLLK